MELVLTEPTDWVPGLMAPTTASRSFMRELMGISF
jgi:hypothetical protein